MTTEKGYREVVIGLLASLTFYMLCYDIVFVGYTVTISNEYNYQFGETALEALCCLLALYACCVYEHSLLWPIIIFTGGMLIKNMFLFGYRYMYLFMPNVMYNWDLCKNLMQGKNPHEDMFFSGMHCYTHIMNRSSPLFFAPFWLVFIYGLGFYVLLEAKTVLEDDHQNESSSRPDTQKTGTARETNLFEILNDDFSVIDVIDKFNPFGIFAAFALMSVVFTQVISAIFFVDTYSVPELVEICLWVVCFVGIFFSQKTRFLALPIIILSIAKMCCSVVFAIKIAQFMITNQYPVLSKDESFSWKTCFDLFDKSRSTPIVDCFEGMRSKTFPYLLNNIVMCLLVSLANIFFIQVFTSLQRYKNELRTRRENSESV